MKFKIYNLIFELPEMQLPLERGLGGFILAEAYLP
jgi:hypothetical protein